LDVLSTGGSAHTKVTLFPARLFLTFIYKSHQRFVPSPLNFPSLLAEVGHTLDPSHSPQKRNQWVGGFRPRFTAILSTVTLLVAIAGIASLLPP